MVKLRRDVEFDRKDGALAKCVVLFCMAFAPCLYALHRTKTHSQLNWRDRIVKPVHCSISRKSQ